MNLQIINFARPDETAIFQYRWSLFEKFLSEEDGNVIASNKRDENKLDANTVSILNLPSLKRGNMASKPPTAKLETILSDKQRLCSWIESYKKSLENDPVKIATFREASSRLKMLLDHSDFDEGDLRNKRRKAIEEIDDIMKDTVNFD